MKRIANLFILFLVLYLAIMFPRNIYAVENNMLPTCFAGDDFISFITPKGVAFIAENKKLQEISQNAQTLFGSEYSLLFIDKQQRLWGWGVSMFGELGAMYSRFDSPMLLFEGAAYAATEDDTYVIDMNKNLLQLDRKAVERGEGITFTPILSDVTQVSAGGGHAVALKSDNTLWGWGWNICGGIGDGTSEDRASPVRVDTSRLQGRKIIKIKATSGQSYVVTEGGGVWICGGDPRLCHGAEPVVLIPLSEHSIFASSAKNFQIIKDMEDTGYMTYVVLLADNSLWDFFTETKLLTDVREVSVCSSLVLARKYDGSLWLKGNRNVLRGATDKEFIQVVLQ